MHIHHTKHFQNTFSCSRQHHESRHASCLTYSLWQHKQEESCVSSRVFKSRCSTGQIYCMEYYSLMPRLGLWLYYISHNLYECTHTYMYYVHKVKFWHQARHGGLQNWLKSSLLLSTKSVIWLNICTTFTQCVKWCIHCHRPRLLSHLLRDCNTGLYTWPTYTVCAITQGQPTSI